MSERIEKMFTQEEIEKRVDELAQQISRDYAGKEIRMVGILKGAVFFMCDLAKRITVPVSIDFMQASSYGSATESTGTVRIRKDLDHSIENRDVIIVEDIVDSGLVDLKADYAGFEVPDEFVVGYGMDYDEKYRNLPYIGILHFDEDK